MGGRESIVLVLQVKDLRFHYGRAEVIKGVSMTVDEGEIVSLVGSNGAGKTTILSTICGLRKATACEVWFQSQRIDGLPAHKVVSLGIALCPEGRRIFYSMKVVDNLLLGGFLRKNRKEVATDLEDVYKHFPILRGRGDQLAGSLSGGEQQMLAMGRALMSKPKLLLLDEPSLGLSPLLVIEVARIIRNINKTKVSIVLVEQNARMAFGLSNRAYVLETGKIILEGKSADLGKDQRVRKAYFGGN
jgi:branched-chain amino acid transport system ATP-binding protein